MKGAPRSDQFDDIYFSAENGLEETRHVFLQGNHLPENWQGKERFTIGETGFGTGLNFLSAWKLFDETADLSQELDFVSVEKFPLTPDEIKKALAPWADYFGRRIDDMLALYPIRVAGFHRLKVSSNVTLTLIFDDVNEALPKLSASIDCWFLDGFTPAKNPDMWTEKVFQEMARLSSPSATYATFTAASDVRRGLEAAGFSVAKQEGFGRKRDMIAGRFLGKSTVKKEPIRKRVKIAIIGGGLAGTSCAYVLKQYGFDPVIYERSDSLASGASGNEMGLYNPRFTAQRDFASHFFVSAYARFIQFARQAGEAIDYHPCGALHLVNTPEKEKRFHSLVQKWLWHSDHVRLVDAQEAGEIAGVPLDRSCLYLPDAGSVSPENLCRYYAEGIDMHYNRDIQSFDEVEADAIIIANANGAQEFDVLSFLELEKVRGQITKVQSSPVLSKLQCNIHYGGYVSAAINDHHMIGATFQKWIDHQDVVEEDHQENINKMKQAIPALKDEDVNVEEGRASFRSATNDRFPLVGRVPDQGNIFVSAAFGSHGVIGSLMAAQYIADLLRNGPVSLPADTAKALSPQRFLDRAQKRARISA